MATLLKAAHAMELSRAMLLVPDFISEAEQSILLVWARSMRPHLRGNGSQRMSSRVECLPDTDPLWQIVRLRIQRLMGLADDAQAEARFGFYLSIISAGGAVHKHIDAAPHGMRHLRCNLFLQLPNHGARPIISNIAVDVSPRMLLAFYPSELPHQSEAFSGDRERILLSYGYTVPADHQLPRTA